MQKCGEIETIFGFLKVALSVVVGGTESSQTAGSQPPPPLTLVVSFLTCKVETVTGVPFHCRGFLRDVNIGQVLRAHSEL